MDSSRSPGANTSDPERMFSEEADSRYRKQKDRVIRKKIKLTHHLKSPPTNNAATGTQWKDF